MHQTHYIVREPLLDPKQQVIGYELSWQRGADEHHSGAALESLIAFVASQVVAEDGAWLLRSKLLFLDAVPAMLSTDALFWMPPEFTVLTLEHGELRDADTLAAVQGLRAGGLGISLRNIETPQLSRAVASVASYVEVRFSGVNVTEQARTYSALKQAGVRMVGRPVTTWADFNACAALGLDAFVGKLHLTPHPGAPVKAMNAAQMTILELMHMVQANDDIKNLETMLKRDPALSYRLLRYINSASFSAGREVQSLRQAIALMGYAPLYRWLTVLLATASTSGFSPVLMETAVVRGRLTELLGAKALGKGEGENLFVAGMFSLLDLLIGLPMEKVLATIQLPENVIDALLNRGGVYGPYLALAEACELHSDLVASLAASLDLTPMEVNKAHLSALAWAQSVS